MPRHRLVDSGVREAAHLCAVPPEASERHSELARIGGRPSINYLEGLCSPQNLTGMKMTSD
jgi:hypothetical protein